jgi:glycosyltransferase involved in cell wall biosynthesis
MSPPPVVINGSSLWPPVTGVQRVARGLTRRLRKESALGEVALLGAPDGFDGPSGWWQRGRVRRALWEQAALPVRARSAHAVLNLGNLAPIATQRSLVITYDLHALQLPHHYRSGMGRAYWAMSKAAFHRARWRVAISRTIATELEETLGRPVDDVVYPGIDDEFRPAPPEHVEEVLARLRLDPPYVVMLGWAQPAKRGPLAVAAHRRVVGDVPHRLVLVGEARPDFPPVPLGDPSPSVVMAGRLDDAAVASLLTGSQGLLFPSEYEGFGLPPVEALACGASVASSAIPVLREVLGDLPGVSFVEGAAVSDWAEALEGLLRGGGDAGQRSRAALARYPWEGKGRQLLRVVGR